MPKNEAFEQAASDQQTLKALLTQIDQDATTLMTAINSGAFMTPTTAAIVNRMANRIQANFARLSEAWNLSA